MRNTLFTSLISFLLFTMGCKHDLAIPEPEYVVKIEDLVGTWISIDSFAVRTDSINYFTRETVEIDTTVLPKNYIPYLPIKPYCVRKVAKGIGYYTIAVDKDSMELHYMGPSLKYIFPRKFKTYLSANKDTLTVTNFSSCLPRGRFNQFIKL